MTASLLLNPAKTAVRLKSLEYYLFLLLVFFFPTQLGKHFWPDFAFVAGMRIDYLSPTLYFTDVLIVLFFAVWNLRVFLTGGLGKVTSIIRSRRTLIRVFLFFLATCLVSMALADRPILAMFGFIRILETLLFGCIAATYLSDKKAHRFTAFVFAASMLLQSLLAIGQFYTQGSLGGLLYYLGERTFTSSTPGIANASLDGTLVLRPYATLPHPNMLAGYLLLGGLYVFSAVGMAGHLRRFIWSILVIAGIALVLTLSRVVIVLSVGVVVTLLVRTLWRKPVTTSSERRSLGIVLFSAIALLLGGSSILLPRFAGTSLLEEAVVQRAELLSAAFAMLRDNPLVGVGIQHYLVKLPAYQYAAGQAFFIQPVHSIYALVGAELGIVGLSLFLVLLYYTYSRIIKTNSYFLFPHLILFCLLVLGFVDHYLLTLQQGRLLFAFIMAYLWSVPLKEKLSDLHKNT